jgi:hypothetical protein
MISDINTARQMTLYASEMPNALMCTDKKTMFLYAVEGRTKKCIAVCSCVDFNTYMEGEGKTKFKVTLKKSSRLVRPLIVGAIMLIVLIAAIAVTVGTGGLAIFAVLAGFFTVKGMHSRFGCCIDVCVSANADNDEVHIRRL